MPAVFFSEIPGWRGTEPLGSHRMNKYPALSARGRSLSGREETLSLEEIYDRRPKECPYCHSKNVRPHGYTKSNHRHRYICGECRHTFASSIGTIYYRGRIDQNGVRLACDSLNMQMTVRETSKLMKVNKNTAMRYRRLFLGRILERAKDTMLSGNDVQVD